MPEVQANAREQTFPPVISGGFQTDDRGIYRIYGIPAGRYKISVGLADDNYYSGGSFGRVAYKRTFYPNTTDPDDAKIVEITEGAEATDIDIAVGRSLPAFSASGKIVDGETGQPVTGLRLGLRRVITDRESPMLNGIISASNSLGEFHLENITPGKYAVLILPVPGSEVRVEAATFDVVDQDVTGLLLKTLKGLAITGTVVLDGTYDKSIFAKLAELRLQVYVNSESPNVSSWQESVLNADGSFRLGGLTPGTANFSLTGQNRRPAASFAIQRVEHDGIVQPRGFVEIKAGERITGLKIIVSYGMGSIRGEVKLENDQLPPGGRTIVWIRKPSDMNSSFRSFNVDSRGHFLIEGVAAGTYELNVNAQIPGHRMPLTAKQTVIVSEGAASDVAVTLDLNPIPDKP